MTASITDLEKRLEILEARARPDTDCEAWQLLRRLRAAHGLPEPDPADYAYGSDVREMFMLMRRAGSSSP